MSTQLTDEKSFAGQLECFASFLISANSGGASMVLFRSADPIWLVYSSLTNAVQWWRESFDCEQVETPEDWGDSLPSDVALKFRGEKEATISLSSKSEAQAKNMQQISTVPIIYSDKLHRAHEHLRSRGVLPGDIQTGGDVHFFELQDLEGNTIEVCEEP